MPRKLAITDHDIIDFVLRDRIAAREEAHERKKKQLADIRKAYEEAVHAAFLKTDRGRALAKLYPNVKATRYNGWWSEKGHGVSFETFDEDGKSTRYFRQSRKDDLIEGEVQISATLARPLRRMHAQISEMEKEIRDEKDDGKLGWKRAALRRSLTDEDMEKIRRIVVKAVKAKYPKPRF